MPHRQAVADHQAGIAEHESRGIDASPKLDVIGDRWVRGWGIGVDRREGSCGSRRPEIAVTMMRCTKGGLLAGVKELLGFPIPELEFTVGAASVAGGQARAR